MGAHKIMKTYSNNEILIFKMIEEIKSLNEEMAKLKRFIENSIPFSDEMTGNDRIIPGFTRSRQYRRLVRKYDFDFFNDDPVYKGNIEKIKRQGCSADTHLR